MESSEHVSALIALAAGFLSFVSPCVLPLVPSYMVFITGLSFDQLEHEDKAIRRVAMKHSVAFVLGFGLVFVAMGASATALGQLLIQYQGVLTRVGGLIIVFLGLYLAGAFKLMALESEHRIHLAHKPHGLVGSLLVGITFALGWTPCIGPMLGSIMIIASKAESVGKGMFLLALYALGLGIPFLIAGIAFPWFLARMRRLNRYVNYFAKGSGILLIVVGVLMVTNQFGQLTGLINRFVPTADLERFLPK